MAEQSSSVAGTLPSTDIPIASTATAAAAVTLGYMVLAFAGLVAAAPGEPRGALLLAVHGVILAALAVAWRAHGGAARFARAWLPLAAIPVLYAELPYLIALAGGEFRDPVVQRWEQLVWGGQAARSLASAFPWTPVSEVLHLAYVSYYAMIYVPIAYLWIRAERGIASAEPSPHRRAFEEASLAVMVAFAICFAAFVLFPVQGPRYLWHAPEGVPDGPVRGLVLAILEQGSSRGAAFPSSHMAVAVVQAMMALRWRVPGRVVIAVATIGVGVGAVYGGFHYAVDMLAGAVLGAGVFLGVRWWAGSRR